jgi:hypothetical protein
MYHIISSCYKTDPPPKKKVLLHCKNKHVWEFCCFRLVLYKNNLISIFSVDRVFILFFFFVIWFLYTILEATAENQVSLWWSSLWTRHIVLIKCDASHKKIGTSFRNKITNRIAGYEQTLAFTIAATLSIQIETAGVFRSR